MAGCRGGNAELTELLRRSPGGRGRPSTYKLPHRASTAAKPAGCRSPTQLARDRSPSSDICELPARLGQSSADRDSELVKMTIHGQCVAACLNGSGKLVMESVIETKASSILQFIHGLRGELHVTWEEGTWAAWLYDLQQPQVARVLVCDPRRTALLKEGNKSEQVDAR
jgi:hypothetical protein